MQTFLPSGYSFSPDKLANPHAYKLFIEDYNQTIHNCNSIAFALVIIFIAAIAIKIWDHIVRNEELQIHTSDTIFVLIMIPFVIVCVINLLGDPLTESQNYPLTEKIQDYYRTRSFKLPMKSNLKVKMSDEANRPKSVKDQKEYPYKIYLNNPKKYKFHLESNNWRTTGDYQLYTEKRICIGEVRDGEFKPAGNSLAAKFNKYHAYIMKHHLSDKFAKTMTLKPNGNYITINGDVQWVLSNEKDLVLYLYHGSKVKESKINN